MSETEDYLKRASDPAQYDRGEVDWTREGDGNHFTRRMILEAIDPLIGDVAGVRVLDVGTGTGWLCDELTERGARTIGIDPSQLNIALARERYPYLKFEHTSLADFETVQEFGLVTATMAFEHLADLPETFKKIRSLMKQAGRLAIVSGDIERYTMPRFGYSVDVQPNKEREGEVAVRTNYGERAGVLYDIFRSPVVFEADAALAGLKMNRRVPYSIPDWVLQDQQRYQLFEGKPVFQVFEFERV